MGNKKDKKKGGARRALMALVVLVAVGIGALYLLAPDALQRGLQLVGLDVSM